MTNRLWHLPDTWGEVRRLKAENERLWEALREKEGQPILNAARRMVKATDNAERNAALGDLVAALAAEEKR